MDMDQQRGSVVSIGAAIGRAVDRMTGSSTPSARSPIEKPAIRLPETVEECAALKAWAEGSPPAAVTPVTSDQLARHLRFMAATLPSKSVDDESGKMRFAVYTSLLSRYSDEAIAFMAKTACQTLDWFPTPRQCIEIVECHRRQPSDRETALEFVYRFTQDRFESWLDRVMSRSATEAEINDSPEQWRRIASERGGLRYCSDAKGWKLRIRPDPFIQAAA